MVGAEGGGAPGVVASFIPSQKHGRSVWHAEVRPLWTAERARIVAGLFGWKEKAGGEGRLYFISRGDGSCRGTFFSRVSYSAESHLQTACHLQDAVKTLWMKPLRSINLCPVTCQRRAGPHSRRRVTAGQRNCSYVCTPAGGGTLWWIWTHCWAALTSTGNHLLPVNASPARLSRLPGNEDWRGVFGRFGGRSFRVESVEENRKRDYGR